MTPTSPTFPASSFSVLPRAASWRDVALPKEHGSWSLALEPVVLGLLVAPSWSAAWLGLALVAGFFSRRPLKILLRDPHPERRATARGVFALLSVVVGASVLAALEFGPATLFLSLLPIGALGAAFLWFDLRNAGREGVAEGIGAAAFALAPGAMATAAGWPAIAALALAWAMVARAVPTVLTVRACVRARKQSHPMGDFVPAGLAAGAAIVAVIGAGLLAARGALPWAVVAALAVLLIRTLLLVCFPRLNLRARTLGFIELALGIGFVATAALAWRFLANA